MSTRSAKLGASTPPAGVTISLDQPPAGQTHLVKSVQVWNFGAIADNVKVWLHDPIGADGVLIGPIPLAVGARLEWLGWAAFKPGDDLFVLSANGQSTFWASGTKLLGVV